MRSGKSLIQILLVLIVTVKCGFSQQNKITIQIGSAEKQISFAGEEIKKAAESKGYTVTLGKSLNAKSKDEMIVKVISDSVLSVKTCRTDNLKMPPKFGWQCYSIRVKETGSQKVIYVLSGDKSGAMYGGFDIAEAIRLGTIELISDSDNKPYLERRGIKFNIPLDLRTPSYSDMGDAAQQNIPVVWEMDFWQQQFDEMARNRYNVISFWSENPFPSLVKIPEFPEIALDDVWRTKTKLGDDFSLSGKGYLTTEMLNNYEVVKKITIDEKIEFWKRVMEYAHNRGIEVYWFTWNIFTYGVQGKYGIDDRQNNDTTISYFRSAVRQMALTYPNLDGIGITAGENMQGNKSKYSNEEWLWKTYGKGIEDALLKQPGRKVRLIHRFHQTNFNEIVNAFKDYPGILEFSYKYSVAHMYSVPNPPYIKSYMNLFSPQRKTWLTVRNDDIYSFRWGNPAFARQYILSIPEPEKIAGFYMGPDGYTWGRDFLGKDNISARPLIIQKQWYSFMLWGRLSYDPDLKDNLFLKTIEAHFKGVTPKTLMDGWSAASMIFPWITRFSWGDIDLKWFPEACISDAGFKGFYTVKDFMEVEPAPGSHISNVIRWAQNYKLNLTDSLISPLAAADTLSRYARMALISLKSLPARKIGTSDEIDLTLGDIEAFAAIGNYYAEKIRGASSLALYNFYGLKQDQDDAIQHLTNARSFWARYASIYDSQYKPSLLTRIGFVNIPELIEKTDQDIEIARNWVPGTIKEYIKGKIIYP
ncbi:MAG TPA: carbohydrate-binding family 6 protein [Bacteroidales bacterium]|nr:carbohydrate-binding family 6 protein [Bacteroidales bacterium]HBZ20648.1 carbohydrate-binding family 6 protein [Bacteroidales bacterium]